MEYLWHIRNNLERRTEKAVNKTLKQNFIIKIWANDCKKLCGRDCEDGNMQDHGISVCSGILFLRHLCVLQSCNSLLSSDCHQLALLPLNFFPPGWTSEDAFACETLAAQGRKQKHTVLGKAGTNLCSSYQLFAKVNNSGDLFLVYSLNTRIVLITRIPWSLSQFPVPLAWEWKWDTVTAVNKKLKD